MRGNWDTTEPFVHAPNQQRQQQQQTIVEEQRHPLHSPTTPVWGIADRIVKEEPSEDKNNDSGVSPDHYTSNSASPRSRLSSSTVNCSLSPGSATSQDSNNMQCTTFDYSPQTMFKSCDSPLEYTRHHSMDDHPSEQMMDVVSSTVKQSSEDVDLGQDTLQCPICAFSTMNRLNFTEHLTSHCNTKCESPEFVKNVLAQLSTTGSIPDDTNLESPKGERSEHDSEDTDKSGLRIPRVNSQGKVKTFKCKQCNFMAITKLEFWEHSRGHIKAEKLLTCPKCPFVTEYKHHLEYHLRNHFGSKPFKCDKCSYSCVNKSMLNSHLKSHSNVYQYRCANCSYATKYCHSLKLHLRKYSHQPAMVLNADGSPNPLPIIDVYGTRRGPKQKSSIKMEDEQSNQSRNITGTNELQSLLSSPHLVIPPQVSPVGHRLIASPANSTNGINSPNDLHGVPHNPPAMTFPYNQMFPGFPLPYHFSAPEDGTPEKFMDRIKSNALMDYTKAIDGERILEEFPRDLAIRCFGVNGTDGAMNVTNGVSNCTNNPSKVMNESIATTEMKVDVEDKSSTDSKVAPLDLSKPYVGNHNQQSHQQSDQHRASTNSPKATGTSRRKGRAVKLDRRVVEDDTDEEQHHREEPEESFEPPAASSPGWREFKFNNNERNNVAGIGASSEFVCQYCEIAFGNVVMYTVHMGYHGYKNPYTCNMCGHQCTDKVSFFLHIGRSEHS